LVQKLREKWTAPNCKEIVFDTYPGLPEYMEIECETINDLHTIMKKLNLTEEKYFNVYETLYGINNKKINNKKNAKLNDLTFDTAKKIFNKYILRNKSLFNKILKLQRKYVKAL
jgi:hypothetical protein